MDRQLAPDYEVIERGTSAADLLRAALDVLDADGLSMAAIHVSMALGVLGERESEGNGNTVCLI